MFTQFLGHLPKYTLLHAALQQFPERKLFCPKPFKRIEIMAGATQTNLCCWITRSPGSLHNQSLMEIWNSPVAQEIRASILDGTFRYCDLEACPYFSSGSLPLQRDCGGTPYEAIIREKRKTLATMKVWLACDRRCNLRCLSCRTDYIHLSTGEQKHVKHAIESVKQNLNQITALGVSGNGEPLASPETRELLFNLKSRDYPHLHVYLLTNGILLSPDYWDKMNNLQPAIVSIQVSVDAATTESYKKIRRGGDFETLMQNLRFISTLRRNDAIKEFIISFVVNAFNVHEMKAFVEMGFELGCDHIFFSYLANWGTFTDEEYTDMAVHRPEHKNHPILQEMLNSPIFRDPRVFTGNLGNLQKPLVLSDSMFM